MFSKIWKNRELLWQLTQRDILMRYRGSLLGVFWSIITPLFMLVVYTFVFGVVFKARWDKPIENHFEFALILFCGLIVFNLFTEIVTRSPSVILNNPNYIKRVVFPVEILPLTLFGSAILNAAIGFIILAVSVLFIGGSLNITFLYLPLILLPLVLFALGLAWFLAATGVYLRDIAQVVPIFLTALMFLSPIFYPISVIPEYLRWAYLLNPIGYVVEDARQVVIWGNTPNWQWLGLGSAFGLTIAILGYVWFQKTKKGFVDVI